MAGRGFYNNLAFVKGDKLGLEIPSRETEDSYLLDVKPCRLVNKLPTF